MPKITKQEEQAIISSAYDFFFDLFKKKSADISKKKYRTFKINPFVIRAAARCFGDDTDPKNIAKAIVYPFSLGTSFSTTFGTKLQQFMVKASNGIAQPSTASGMDIEYIDAIDNRKKYCQLKSGPTTINKGDVKSIEDDFTNLRNLSRTNNLKLQDDDYVLGVLYGDHDDLSSMYKKIEKDGYTIFAGDELWYHIIGTRDIYQKLIYESQKAAANAKMDDGIKTLLENTEKGIRENMDFFGL